MNKKQSVKLRKLAAKISKGKSAVTDTVTGKIKVEDLETKNQFKLVDLYTRKYTKDSNRRIFRQLKKMFNSIPRPMRFWAIARLKDEVMG